MYSNLKDKKMKKLLLGALLLLSTLGATSCSTDNECVCLLKINELFYTDNSPHFKIVTCEGESTTLSVNKWGYYNINTCFEPNSKTNNISGFPNENININLNLNLPQYSSLQFEGNYMIVDNILIVNNGYDYKSYSLKSPNNSNITLYITNGKLKCNQTQREYLLFTGKTSDQQYSIKEYLVVKNGSSISITN